jgi:hypothetical protein
MSFQDYNGSQQKPSSVKAVRSSASSGAAQSMGGGGGGGGGGVSDLLITFQRNYMKIKDIMNDFKRRTISPAEKGMLDMQLREQRDLEQRLRSQLDTQMKLLDSQQRTGEVAQKRLAIVKLQKDFERLKIEFNGILNIYPTLKVKSNDPAPSKQTGRAIFHSIGGDDEIREPEQSRQSAGMGTMKVLAVQQDVDQMLREERERDLKKMNQDLVLVNEMMKDVANIVESQGKHVEEIHETTEKSHNRAQAGLNQVQQAAANQGSCIIS